MSNAVFLGAKSGLEAFERVLKSLRSVLNSRNRPIQRTKTIKHSVEPIRPPGRHPKLTTVHDAPVTLRSGHNFAFSPETLDSASACSRNTRFRILPLALFGISVRNFTPPVSCLYLANFSERSALTSASDISVPGRNTTYALGSSASESGGGLRPITAQSTMFGCDSSIPSSSAEKEVAMSVIVPSQPATSRRNLRGAT